jgi:hypothetical protein
MIYLKRISRFIFLFLLLSVLSCYNIDHIKNRNNPDFSKDSDILIYKMNRKLNWDHFKGTPPDTITNMTYLNTTIQMYNNVNVWWGTSNFDAYGIVFMSESWVTQDMINDLNLNHQQKLFDISEIFAQRLENDLNRRRISPSKRDEITKIFNSYDDELQKYQMLYEKETKFGMDSLKQKIWDEKIDKELFELKNSPIP